MLQNMSTKVNQTEISSEEEDEMAGSMENVPLMVSYIILSLVGVTGNSLVITLVRKNSSFRSTTNILLAFVAVADLISLTCFVPFAFFLVFPLPSGVLGSVLCWVFARGNVASLTVTVSITTLALLAIERFHALVKPLNNRLRIARENVIYWIFGISVYAVALIVPLFIFTVFDKRKKTCFHEFGNNGRRIYFSIFGFGVALVLAVICFCYCRIIKGFYFGCQNICVSEELQRKRKVIKLLLIITLAFIVCFTPRTIYFLFYHSNSGLLHKTSLFLLHCNSAMNPVILGFQSERYRCGFKEIISEFTAKTKRFCYCEIRSYQLDMAVEYSVKT